jgi:hypothetical protein
MFFALELLDTVANPFKDEWDHDPKDKLDKPTQRFFFRSAVRGGGIGLTYYVYAALSIAAISIASLLFYPHLAFFAALFFIWFGLPYMFGYYEFDKKGSMKFDTKI